MRCFKILIICGLFFGLFFALVPLTGGNIFDLSAKKSDMLKNIIYYRGILLGFLMVSIGSAAFLKDYCQNAVIALGGGVAALLIASTINLIYGGIDESKNLYPPVYYLHLTFAVIFILFIILTVVRLWLSKVLEYLK